MQQSGTRAFQPKKDTGECFSTTRKLESTCKNSGTFELKKNFTRKSHLGQFLHQAIQLHPPS